MNDNVTKNNEGIEFITKPTWRMNREHWKKKKKETISRSNTWQNYSPIRRKRSSFSTAEIFPSQKRNIFHNLPIVSPLMTRPLLI